MKKLMVVKIQRFSTHDGPGIRTAVFLKGCPLRCEWCHNPETQKPYEQVFYRENECVGCGSCVRICPVHAHGFDMSGRHIYDRTLCKGCLECASVCPTGAIEGIGKLMSADEITDSVLRDSAFFGEKGGITVSGGEPMFQPEGCLELLGNAKGKNLSAAVETCGFFDSKYAAALASAADLLLWDFKDGDPERHKKYTGIGNDEILKNLFIADKFAKRIVLRCIMVRGINMDDVNINAIADAYHRLRNCGGVELIPYHAYGGSKSKQLGGIDDGKEDWIPSDSEIKLVSEKLVNKGVVMINA